MKKRKKFLSTKICVRWVFGEFKALTIFDIFQTFKVYKFESSNFEGFKLPPFEQYLNASKFLDLF